MTIHSWRLSAVGFLIVLHFGGCVWIRDVGARCYDLNTGKTIHAKLQNLSQGYGRITATTPEGDTLLGDYSISGGMPAYRPGLVRPLHGVDLSRADSAKASPGGSANEWSSWAEEYGFPPNAQARPAGTATLTNEKGMVLQIVFFSMDLPKEHGDGVGRDNRDNHYRVYVGEWE